MIVARTRAELAAATSTLRAASGPVALVPTMGFLHEGHLSLVDRARELADSVVVSIFVNPLQFGPAEDLATYPRDEARDRALLEARGTNVVFAPTVEEMYPGGDPIVTVSPGALEHRLCGKHRPGHFRGVLTVVAKLFGLVRPDVAVFGRKDFQQAVLIRRMARDLELGVRVETGPIVREDDGLAMSSRNAYLSPAQRQQATTIYRGLRKAKTLLDSGERDAAELAAIAIDLLREEQDLVIDYVAVCDPETLERIPEVEKEAVLLVAARVGDTRLIDNIRLEVKGARRRR
jgi:pantoate--beta-alanine ligase